MSQCHIAWQPWQLTLPSHIRITQARSASDNSANNPVCWVVWCLPAGRLPRSHLRHSPAQPTFLLCGPHLFIVNPCNLYGWRGIVYSTTGYSHSRRRLAPLCPSSIRRTGETGTACLRVVLERSLGCPLPPPKGLPAHPRAPTLPSIKSSPPSVAKLFSVSPPSLHYYKRSAYLLSYRLWRLSQALAPCKPPRFLAKHNKHNSSK